MVNQPTVPDTSTGADIASRPWPSRWTTSEDPLPRRWTAAAVRAVSITASGRQLKAPGRVRSTLRVRPGSRSKVRSPMRPPAAGTSVRRAVASANCRSHQGSSSSRSAASRESSRDHRVNEAVPAGAASSVERPSSAAASSCPSTRQENPSTARWCTVSSSAPGLAGAGVEPHRPHHLAVLGAQGDGARQLRRPGVQIGVRPTRTPGRPARPRALCPREPGAPSRCRPRTPGASAARRAARSVRRRPPRSRRVRCRARGGTAWTG